MHVAFDLDDVVLDFSGGLKEVVYREYGVRPEAWERDYWDLHSILDPIIGESWWKWMRERDWLWALFPAVPGAIGGLRTLRRDGFYLECLTAKPEWAEPQVWRWLGRWRPPFNRVTVVSLDEMHSKADFTEASLLVDDKPENLDSFVVDDRGAILFDRSHNQTALGYKRALDWKEVVTYVRDYREPEGLGRIEEGSTRPRSSGTGDRRGRSDVRRSDEVRTVQLETD